jgi:hypothetical protein
MVCRCHNVVLYSHAPDLKRAGHVGTAPLGRARSRPSKFIQRDEKAFSRLVALVPPSVGIVAGNVANVLPCGRCELGALVGAFAPDIEGNRHWIVPEQFEWPASDVDCAGLEGKAANAQQGFLDKLGVSGLDVRLAKVATAVGLPVPVVFRVVAFVAGREKRWGFGVISPVEFSESHRASTGAFSDEQKAAERGAHLMPIHPRMRPCPLFGGYAGHCSPHCQGQQDQQHGQSLAQETEPMLVPHRMISRKKYVLLGTKPPITGLPIKEGPEY